LNGFAKRGLKRTMTAMSTAADPASGETSPGEKAAILLIDDENALLEVYTMALSPYFEVSKATSTREAEFILRQKKFKVVVTDHLMPGGNGMNFLVRTREEYPEMQRVLVTAYMKPEMLLRSVNEAALFRYLLKPISMGELVKVVQEAARLHDQTVRPVVG
jgi:two-component system response regulator HupR/HoxA